MRLSNPLPLAALAQPRFALLPAVRFVFGIAVLIALTCGVLAAPAALAQTTFTEFAFMDSTFSTSPATDFWIASAAPADVDADGDFDLLVAGTYVIYNQGGEERLTLYRNDGASGDTTWALTPVPVEGIDDLTFGSGDIAWGDYDNDSDLDVVVAGDGALALFRNDSGAGSSTLVRTSTVMPAYYEDADFSTFDLRSLSWTDYDNDGDLDLLLPSITDEDQQEYVPTRLLRNDGPGAGDAWAFTDADAGLPVTTNAMSAWGDMDSDGDLDLMLANVSPWENEFLLVYRNDGGALVVADTGLAHIRYGMADWGDADNDGDLDLLVSGNLNLPDGMGETVVRILFHQDGTYTPVDILDIDFPNPDEPWLDFIAATWADYDSDGDVDILVSGEWLGEEDIVGRALVYANVGGTFTAASDPLPAPIGGQSGGAFTWFDIDGDGDLDYFVSGAYFVDDGNGLIEARAQLFRNDATRPNAPPTAPADLAAVVDGGGVTLDWGPAIDGDTPSDALTYNLWVRRGPGSDIVSPMSRPGGGRMTPEAGNVSLSRRWQLHGLTAGTYTWTVQAVDNAFNGGSFAVEGTFTVGPTAGEQGPAGAAVTLRGVMPNPSAGGAAIVFDLPAPAAVGARVFDALGREVLVVPARPVEAGAGRTLALDVSRLPAGAYVVRLEVRHGDSAEWRTARLTVIR